MKKTAIIAALAAVVALNTAPAQTPTVYPLEYGESVQPLSMVKVEVTVRKETVEPGPYARYAQKFLGAMAPLNARTSYEITGAALRLDEFTFDRTSPDNTVRVRNIPNAYDPSGFVKFAIDRTSLSDRTAEAMAQDAANTIYTLRKRRFDLVTGEAGEHVYGAGLEAALAEMARIEEEYAALFMGKTTVETYTATFEVVPEVGKTTYVVCRFSPEEGLVPENDLGAGPLVLTMTDEGGLGNVVRSDKKTGNLYRVARWMDCRLLDGTEQLAAKRLPLFQFGETVIGR